MPPGGAVVNGGGAAPAVAEGGAGIPGSRGGFGGGILAFAVDSSLREVARAHPGYPLLLSCTGTFLAPARVEACRASVDVVRRTRNYCHVLTRLTQDGEVVHILTAVLGASYAASPRASLSAEPSSTPPRLIALPPPRIAGVAACDDSVPWGKGSTVGGVVELRMDPASAVGMRRASDEQPQGAAALNMWARMRDGRPHSFATTAYISDLSNIELRAYRAAFMRRYPGKSVSDATLSMTVHWYQDPAPAGGGAEWLQLRSASSVLSTDRHEFHVALWKADGSLVCTSSQLQVMKVVGEEVIRHRL